MFNFVIDMLSTLLKSTTFFCVKEEIIWKWCVEWSRYGSNSRDGYEWTRRMESVKYDIRYTLMSEKFFSQHVVPSNVLTTEETSNILLKIRDKSRKQESLSSINLTWANEPPTKYPYKNLYHVCNNNKTIRKECQTAYIIAARINPWIETLNSCRWRTMIFTARVDKIIEPLDKHHRIGIIGQSYWDKCCYLSGFDDCSSLDLSFYDGDIRRNSNVWCKTHHKFVEGNVVQAVIDFKTSVVFFQIFANEKQNEPLVQREIKWMQLGKEKMCFALSVRKIGWEFTLINPLCHDQSL